jgi:hypothetical protein
MRLPFRNAHRLIAATWRQFYLTPLVRRARARVSRSARASVAGAGDTLYGRAAASHGGVAQVAVRCSGSLARLKFDGAVCIQDGALRCRGVVV